MFISDEADYVAMSARIPPPLRNFQLCIFVQDFRREHAENSGGMPKPTCQAPAEIFSKLSLRVFAFLARSAIRSRRRSHSEKADGRVHCLRRHPEKNSGIRYSGRRTDVSAQHRAWAGAGVAGFLGPDGGSGQQRRRSCSEKSGCVSDPRGQLVQNFFCGAHVPELKVGSCPCWPSIKDRRLQQWWSRSSRWVPELPNQTFKNIVSQLTKQNTKDNKKILCQS